MSSKPEYPIQAMGFWMFGFLSVVLAVLKLTVAGYWSWWRVMLPFLAFLGHNAVYLLTGFLCFCWLKYEEDEEEASTVQKHSREVQHSGAVTFLSVFGQPVATHRRTRLEVVLAVLGEQEALIARGTPEEIKAIFAVLDYMTEHGCQREGK